MITNIQAAATAASAEAANAARPEARGAAAQSRLAATNPAVAAAVTSNEPAITRPTAYGVAAKVATSETRREYDTESKVKRPLHRDPDDHRGRHVDREV